ncbi:aminotransferase class I/II-fold pyridoxal phosphate-dependent enzyme [Salinimicrobium soli]|uniref:aminotransferase class I/II-fold pyridoxal phosphate-dependent enzyme n=1 Tax=Salinimicrobium soli TaxID=1254399 RepID=UPI003AAF12E8
MKKLPLKVEKRLQLRKQENSLRSLGICSDMVDLSSNDYLGFSSSLAIFRQAERILQDKDVLKNGATGSRLLTGNHKLYGFAEEYLSDFHNADAALIFNSGYDANLGFFGSVPQKGDVILYDELSHASIRDGISLSKAQAYKFRHNDLQDLEEKILRLRKNEETEVYVVTEAVFSMDGDIPDLRALMELSKRLNFLLVIDEAHSTGVIGTRGKGPLQELGLEKEVFARILTFGKALGAHGAAILGSKELEQYLINFSRSFIYTTALPPHSVATIIAAYQHLNSEGAEKVEALSKNIGLFNSQVVKLGLENKFIKSTSAVHSCIIPGNEAVKKVAAKLQKQGFDVKPILSPTVPEGKERLRFCLHSYNTPQEVQSALSLLADLI